MTFLEARQIARRAGKTLQNAATAQAAFDNHYNLRQPTKDEERLAAYKARREQTRARIAELCKRSVAR